MNSEKVKEIKKALKCCSEGKCEKCLIGKKDIRKCVDILLKDTLTLINELESENERLNKSDTSKEESFIEYYNLYRDFKRENQTLKAENERLKEVIADQNELCWNCKKSVKEFAEKLRKKVISLNVWEFGEIDIIDVDDIDEVLKEYEE